MIVKVVRELVEELVRVEEKERYQIYRYPEKLGRTGRVLWLVGPWDAMGVGRVCVCVSLRRLVRASKKTGRRSDTLYERARRANCNKESICVLRTVRYFYTAED